jgi:tetratricopeptide (TPR) repeat protein
MAQILKLPVQPSKLGYKRVRKRSHASDPNQLDLFPQGEAELLDFAPPDLGPFERALMWDERGDPKAAELYERAIDQEDCVADAFCNLGIIQSQEGNTIKAFDCFTTSLKHNPRHSEAHYNLANLYFDQNDFRLAQVHFEMAVALEPSFANAFFNLALVQAINSDFASALRALRQYEQLVPENERQVALDLFESLKKSLLAAKNSRLASP